MQEMLSQVRGWWWSYLQIDLACGNLAWKVELRVVSPLLWICKQNPGEQGQNAGDCRAWGMVSGPGYRHVINAEIFTDKVNEDQEP